MNKPEVSSMLPSALATSSQAAQAPNAFVQPPAPVKVSAKQASPAPTRPTQQAAVPEYVDPYLFETGYYASQAEYEELSRTAASRIRLRADVENARPKRRKK